MRVNDAVFCCGCNFRAFGGNSPGTLIDCGLQHVSSQSRCGLVLSKDPVAAPLAPVRCDKSAAQAITHWAAGMLLVLINILVIIVVGAILFYLIDRFVRDGRLANLLKILVALVCLAAILQRLLPAFDINLF